jgi:hypothetical protein
MIFNVIKILKLFFLIGSAFSQFMPKEDNAVLMDKIADLNLIKKNVRMKCDILTFYRKIQ